MILLLAAICFCLAIFIYWKLYRLDQDPNVPGPVSHVIIPAVAYPVIVLLIAITLAALAYSLFS
ncbi:hypothetical protein AXX12_04515 [Anaerosporomusa subterranea]|uniref:Uncharacterized protein n=1 Tax=Anaerosporomusa subterranea TaxID=1794912 RepID=A0A154BU17_ANASB|nr:hypothetical protein [Anaerosporomusa subterranea]KYZ77387.1 hypothetical protein AXX12_04515 [Anaerosporomusa subterranea]